MFHINFATQNEFDKNKEFFFAKFIPGDIVDDISIKVAANNDP